MTNYLQADVANVLADIDALMAAYPELADDLELKQDMLEGSTDAFSVLSRLISIERDADAMIKAIAERAHDLSSRKARYEKRKDAMRGLMLKVMNAANIKKASLTEATLSISRGRDSVEVTDIDALADEYIRIERIPDKKALLDILRSDGEIPGARLKMGGDTMTVRVA